MISAFNEAIHNNNGQKPTTIRTDSLRAYINGFKKIGVTGHIEKCGVNKPHATNNRIERLNGILRERVKVQRGWKILNLLSRKDKGYTITS